MKILVCLKQVPHKDARLELASDGSWIQDANIKFEINDYDNYALEEALRIKDKDTASEVLALSIGPDRVHLIPNGIDVLRFAGGGTGRFQLADQPVSWNVTDRWLTVTGPAAPMRLSRRSSRPR